MSFTGAKKYNKNKKMWKVPYRRLGINNLKQRKRLLKKFDIFLKNGQFLMGTEVKRLESKIAQYCKRKYCVGVSSGTDALYLALRSIGIGPDDEVLIPPLSWVATINAVVLAGAKPVFVDVREDQNLNEELLETALTKKTRAIIPVHFTGRLCQMNKICNFAKKNRLMVIEDAAQAFGAYMEGTPAGGFGDLGCFSMNPMKVLASIGEAGAVVTNNKRYYEKLLALRYLGTVNKETCYWPSLNAKIDSIQALILNFNLKDVKRLIDARRKVANFYSDKLSHLVKTPQVEQKSKKNCISTFFSYTIQTDKRDKLKSYLEQCGIETKIHHPILMPDQPAYRSLNPGKIPVARNIVNQILSLPIHEKMKEKDIKLVVSLIKKFFKNESFVKNK